MLDGQCGELIALTEEKTDRPQRARVDLEQGCKGCIEVAFGACMDDMSVQPKRPAATLALSAARRCWSTDISPPASTYSRMPCIVGSRAPGAKVLTRMRFGFRSGSAAT